MAINSIKDLIKSMFHKDHSGTNINQKLNQIYKQEYQKDKDIKVEAPATINWVKSVNMITQPKRGEKYLSNFHHYINQRSDRKWYYFSSYGHPWELSPINVDETYDVAVVSIPLNPTYISIGSIINGVLSISISENTVIPNGQLYVKSASMGAYRLLYSTSPFSTVTSFPILDDMSSFNTTWIDDDYVPQLATTDVVGDFSVIPLYPIVISASEGLPAAGIKTVDTAPLILTNPLFEYSLSQL